MPCDAFVADRDKLFVSVALVVPRISFFAFTRYVARIMITTMSNIENKLMAIMAPMVPEIVKEDEENGSYC